MTHAAFEFDVAISFLGIDEPFANQLADKLSERMTVFLYTKRQEMLAGTDGEQRLNEIFAEKSRLVVVLFRETWGTTPFTRVEETAIKNRAHDEGYDFTVFISMDEVERPKLPRYVPKNRLGVNLKRWGIDGAAVAIEQRLIELDGVVREETIADIARQAARALEVKKLRETHLNATTGVSAQDAAFSEMRIALLKARDEIAAILGVKIDTKDRGTPIGTLIFLSDPAALQVEWRRTYSNILLDAKLEASLWNGHPPWPGMYTPWGDPPTKQASLSFVPDLMDDGTPGWRKAKSSATVISTSAVTEAILKLFLEKVKNS